MARSPNILFIMADQMAARFLPVYGHPLVRAPNLSRLAEQAVVFDSAYCPSPLCSPSRAAMLCGQRPSRTGVYDNAAEFRADIPTFAHYLRQAGYRTALSGKMHFVGPDQLHGFEERLTTDIYPADFGWTPNWADPTARPDFYYGTPAFMEAGPCQRSNQLDYDEETIHAARRHLFDVARSSDRRPFCLVVSMTHPHDPYRILPRYWDQYAEADIDLPDLSTSPDPRDPHWARIRHLLGIDQAKDVTEAHVRRARRAYYGAVSFVDDQVGTLLRTLKEAGLDRDTMVVFSADHGDMLGERGLWDKMTWYENAARVPLLFSFPSGFGSRRVARSISTIDLLPTLAEIAGDGAAPDYAAPIDGRSLLPHLSGSGGHDEVLGEYLAEGAVAPLLMVRRGRLKYIRCEGDPEQLYDLGADPLERQNLAGDPAQAMEMAGLRAQATAIWDEDSLRADVIASQGRRILVDAAMKKGRRTPWDFQPTRDASNAYIRSHLNIDDLEARARLPRA